jgi:BASS family bile acid:Na+ symporter
MSADALFNALFNAGLVVMIITLVLSLGMSFTVTQVVAPLRRVGVIVAAIVINAVVVPGAAWGLASLFDLTTEQRVAIVLLAAASAGPAGLKSAQFAKRADMALAVSFVIVLQLVNIIAAPLWATAVVSDATVSTWMIVKDLLFLVLIPLALGLAARGRYPEHAVAWGPGLEKISNIALVIAIAAGVAEYWHDFVELLGSRVLLAAVVIVVAFAALGWLVGLRHQATAIAGSTVTAMRFTPIGLVVIMTQLDGNGSYLAPALVFALVDTIVPFALGLEIGRHVAKDGKHVASAAPASSTPLI